MFLNEDPRAFAKLKEICQKTFLNKVFFEWETMDGQGQGSSHYAGSAAIITRMIVERLFGIDWSDKKFVLDLVSGVIMAMFMFHKFKMVSSYHIFIILRYLQD